MYCTQFDGWKAFSNNNYLQIEALKAKIDFAFDLTRTVKTEKASKKDKYYDIDSNNNKKCSLFHKFNACLKFILVQCLISLSYKMKFDFDFFQILSMRNKFIACFADKLLKLLVQSVSKVLTKDLSYMFGYKFVELFLYVIFFYM